MKPMILFSLKLSDGQAKWRFYRFTEKEASQMGAVIAPAIQLIAPAESRLVTDHVGRPVKLRWTAGPDESVNESDANEVYEMAERDACGFRFVG
jgi:hypothetical protein